MQFVSVKITHRLMSDCINLQYISVTTYGLKYLVKYVTNKICLKYTKQYKTLGIISNMQNLKSASEYSKAIKT